MTKQLTIMENSTSSSYHKEIPGSSTFPLEKPNIKNIYENMNIITL